MTDDCKSVSVGYKATHIDTQKIYAGRLLKPWAWFKFETVEVVEIDIHSVTLVAVPPRGECYD